MADDDDDLLTTGEAARILGVSDDTVRRWAEARKIPHSVLPSGQLRFAKADLDAAVTRVPVGEVAP